MDGSKESYEIIKEIARQEIERLGLLINPYRLGKVDSVLSPTKLKVFIDGSAESVTVPCNPDVTFKAKDEVWVVLTSRDGKSKFVPFKRGV